MSEVNEEYCAHLSAFNLLADLAAAACLLPVGRACNGMVVVRGTHKHDVNLALITTKVKNKLLMLTSQKMQVLV